MRHSYRDYDQVRADPYAIFSADIHRERLRDAEIERLIMVARAQRNEALRSLVLGAFGAIVRLLRLLAGRAWRDVAESVGRRDGHPLP